MWIRGYLECSQLCRYHGFQLLMVLVHGYFGVQLLVVLVHLLVVQLMSSAVTWMY